MGLWAVDRVVHPAAALLYPDRTPLVLQNSPRKHRSDEQSKGSKNAIYINAGGIEDVYLGEKAVLGEKLGNLRREDDVPAPTKGDKS